MDLRDDNGGVLRSASTAAAVLLATLCAITLITGVSQQHFEWVHAPAVYAADLVRDAGWLRAIVAIDDLFIIAYVTATVALATSLCRERWTVLHVLIVGGGVAAGLLDFEENHQLLALTRWAELELAIPVEVILRRSDLSQLKWMLGHAAFVLVGVAFPKPKNMMEHSFRVSLIYVQLPVGALTWCVVDPTQRTVLIWARYVSFLAGFALIAWFARRGVVAGAATDAPG